MSDDSQRPIIVKKIKKGGHGHHGGAWKIAYADFVTAMMAFFLLMWLLGSVTKGDLKGIADYFQNPFKVALSGGSGAGESQSVMQGGGKDLTKQAGDFLRSPEEGSRRQSKRGEEATRLKTLKNKLDKMMSDKSGSLAQFKDQLILDLTPEGLRIQIVDQQKRAMFKSGSAQLENYTKDILHALAETLNSVPNSMSLSGHTDAAGFSSGDRGYSNWELSADRANASRREMIVGGLSEEKVLRVVGLGSAVPYDVKDPLSPINRRISIIVLTEDAANDIRKQAGSGGAVKEEEFGAIPAEAAKTAETTAKPGQ